MHITLEKYIFTEYDTEEIVMQYLGGKRMIKLIASDIDGTILQHGARDVSPEMIDTINQLIRKGIYFVAASGRTYKNIQLLFKDVTEPMLIIGENGGMYMLHDECYISQTHTKETVDTLIKTIRKDSDCQLAYSCPDTTYVERGNADFISHLEDVVKYHITVVDDFSKLDIMPIKLAIYTPKGGDYILNKYKDLLSEQVNVMTSGNLWVDFMPYGVNKGVALKHIAEMLHIAPEETMAFGDQWNDTEMLAFAGTSYAMTNAAPGVAEFATHTTDSVLKELQKYL